MKITFFESGVRVEIPEKKVDEFVRLGLLDEVGNKYYPRKGKIYFAKKETSNIEEWIDEWRAKWKGKKLGAMGDRNACIKKMQEFMLQHPDYDKELIYQAADAYMASMEGNFKYLMQADYFIYKQDPSTSKVSRSTLASLCEDIRQGGAYSRFIESPFTEDI